MTLAPPPGAPGPFSEAAERAGHPVRSAAARADELLAYISGRRRSFTDWVLVTLTWLALVPNVWLLWWEPHRSLHRHELWYADLALVVLIGLSICWRWLRFRIGWRYLRKHWWEVPALFPLALPVVGQWHWVLWLVLAARVTRVVDRTDNVFGDRITAALVTHFSDPIIEAIKRPITVAVLDEVIQVLQEGTYAANVKAAIDENHAELEAMVLDLVREDPTTGKLKYLPFHDDLVQLISSTVLRMLDGALDDPRTTELISDVIRNSATQLRHAVRAPH